MRGLIGMAAVIGMVASMHAQGLDALAGLKAAYPRGVVWDSKGSKLADVTCHGKNDLIILGRKRGSVVVAVVPSVGGARPGKPIAQEFQVGNAGYQDAFCGKQVMLRLETRICTTGDDIPLDGCKPVKGCRAFRVEDGECDSFHFFWNNKDKTIEWWRL